MISTLLNPRLASAQALACAYHERWEIEIVIDEIDTHQRLVGRRCGDRQPAIAAVAAGAAGCAGGGSAVGK